MSANGPTLYNYGLDPWMLLTEVISVSAAGHKQYKECTGVPFCPLSSESIDQVCEEAQCASVRVDPNYALLLPW